MYDILKHLVWNNVSVWQEIHKTLKRIWSSNNFQNIFTWIIDENLHANQISIYFILL